MFEVRVKDKFSSAHRLRNYNGKCEELHGHNWEVEVFCESAELNEIGLVIDFKELKKYLSEILDLLDHKYLNETEFFSKNNPSSENIAKFIFKEMKRFFPAGGIKLSKVTVWETPTSSASYYER